MNTIVSTFVVPISKNVNAMFETILTTLIQPHTNISCNIFANLVALFILFCNYAYHHVFDSHIKPLLNVHTFGVL